MSEADPQFSKADVEDAPAPADAAVAVAVAAAPVDVPSTKAKPKWRRLVLLLSVPLALLMVGGYFWLTSGQYVSTDNAYVQQDMVPVAAQVNGPVVEVLVHENQFVHRGDVLFRIDREPYRIALAQADAQIAAARVQVNQTFTQSAGTAADIAGAERNLGFAQANFERYAALLQRGFTTRAQYDAAQHSVDEARERLANARADAATARAAIAPGTTTNQPALQAAQVARQQALLNLSRTEVRAPADGYVSQVDRLQVGAAAVSGVPLVTLVRSATTYVEANYKETDLANMFVGQPAEVELDAYPGVRIRGHVDSIGHGTGSQFSLLPAQNANGNWVKVTQRVPVRIAIDGDPGRPMIAGLSAHVAVDVRERPGQRPQQTASVQNR